MVNSWYINRCHRKGDHGEFMVEVMVGFLRKELRVACSWEG